MAPRYDTHNFVSIPERLLMEAALRAGDYYINDRTKLKIAANQTESKRSLKRNKFAINKRR